MVKGRGHRKSLNGRMCPNALLADDIRYDDVTRGGFVFVTGVPLSPQQRALLAGRGTEVLEVQPGSTLYRWLADGNAAAALVRPDFTVLRADRDVAALCDAAPHSWLPEGSAWKRRPRRRGAGYPGERSVELRMR